MNSQAVFVLVECSVQSNNQRKVGVSPPFNFYAYRTITKKLGYKFISLDYLLQALTHRSAGAKIMNA
ncbi:ribonuclease III [Actinobacillus equuli]|nr:ribonuclease III [Actinobacillus equuli]